jgi:hypothetical protein
MSVLKLPRYLDWQGVGGFLLPTPPPEVGEISHLLIGVRSFKQVHIWA